ncbi:atp-dependent rna helicase dbp10 [Moniliophthora roreri]|nr:atp-dependent rna helicase dbp10 [Moniliophthora roreri]
MGFKPFVRMSMPLLDLASCREDTLHLALAGPANLTLLVPGKLLNNKDPSMLRQDDSLGFGGCFVKLCMESLYQGQSKKKWLKNLYPHGIPIVHYAWTCVYKRNYESGPHFVHGHNEPPDFHIMGI